MKTIEAPMQWHTGHKVVAVTKSQTFRKMLVVARNGANYLCVAYDRIGNWKGKKKQTLTTLYEFTPEQLYSEDVFKKLHVEEEEKINKEIEALKNKKKQLKESLQKKMDER